MSELLLRHRITLANGKEILIRPQEPVDAVAVSALLEAAFESPRNGIVETSADLWVTLGSGGVALVAQPLAPKEGTPPGTEDDTRLAGHLLVHCWPDDILEVGIAVAPIYQRQGIARALLTTAIAWRDRLGRGSLALAVEESNVAARALYARCGFVEKEVATLRRHHPDQEHLITMVRP